MEFQHSGSRGKKTEFKAATSQPNKTKSTPWERREVVLQKRLLLKVGRVTGLGVVAKNPTQTNSSNKNREEEREGEEGGRKWWHRPTKQKVLFFLSVYYLGWS